MTGRRLLDLFPVIEDPRVPEGRILFVRRPGRILGVEAEPRTDEDLALRVQRFRVDFTVPEFEVLAASAAGEDLVEARARPILEALREEDLRRREREIIDGCPEAPPAFGRLAAVLAAGRVVEVRDPDVGACRACGARSGCEAAATCDPEQAGRCDGEALGFFPDPDDEDEP